MWAPDAFVDGLLNKLQDRRDDRVELWPGRRTALLAKLRETIGDFAREDGTKPPLDTVVLERTEEDGIVRERIAYTTADGLRVSAYVLAPKRSGKAAKLPAVVALHGHGYGSREIVGLLPDGTPQPDAPAGKNRFALELARKGLIVIAPEIVGFGDRKLRRDAEQNPDTPNSCFPLAAALLMPGLTLAGLRVYEASRALDALAERDDTDAGRIGCIGFSGGGMVASLFAAVDERVRAAVLCGYPNTYRGSVLARRHCLDNYLPGILRHAEMPELIGLIAPRALFIESGTHDRLFPAEQVREAAGALERLYAMLGVKDRFGFDLFEGGHEVSGRRSFDWLAEQLFAAP